MPRGTAVQPALVEQRYRLCLQRMDGCPDSRRKQIARSRVESARTLLKNAVAQRRLRDKLAADGPPTTRKLRCGIDVTAVDHYIQNAGPEADVPPKHKDGTSYSKTSRAMMRELRAEVSVTAGESRGHVKLDYCHSRLGAELVAAGHVLRSREYAKRRVADPFTLPRALRQIALGTVGKEMDDAAAFNRAKAADVRPCRTAGLTLLRERKLILEQVGRYFLPDAHLTAILGQMSPERLAEERYARAKALFLALDMDGSYEGWRHRQQIPRGERLLSGLRARLANGQQWSLLTYIKTMEVGSEWLAQRLPAMMRMVRDWNMHRSSRRREHPERTLASYVFQEAEGISREAKLWWCRTRGHTVHNLQHDGVVAEPARGEAAAAMAATLTSVCSRALGYEQPVEVK